MQEHGLQFAEDLDGVQCNVEGCDHASHDGEIFLHSRCHPQAPTWSSYRAGVMTVSCAVCGRHICAVAVATRDAEVEP
jgi:hypothetical protein